MNYRSMRGPPDPMVDDDNAIIIGRFNGTIIASDKYCTEMVFGTAQCTSKSTAFLMPPASYISSLDGCSSVTIAGYCKRHAKKGAVSLREVRRLIIVGGIMSR